LSLAILLLLTEENAKAHVSDFNISVGPTEDVVRFYVSVKDIVGVHFLKAQGHLEQAVLYELFREISVFSNYDFSKLASLHQLHEDPETVLELIHFFTFDNLVAVQEAH